MRVVFLCSGNGGNLRFVHESIHRFGLPFSISGVYADRPCKAVLQAERLNIPTAVSGNFNADFGQYVSGMSPQVIVTNVHRLVAADNLEKFGDVHWVNLHYSLLPMFAGHIGMKPVTLARQQCCKRIGATTHAVTPQLDDGPVLQQVSFEANWSLSDTELGNTVFEAGAVLLLNTLLHFTSPPRAVQASATHVLSHMPCLFSHRLFTEDADKLEEIYRFISA